MRYLTPAPIRWDRVGSLQRWAARQGGGALVTFVGIVRPDQRGTHQIRALVYEAYAEMAEHQIGQLITQMQAQWSLEAVHLQHRIGLVEIGQMSVVIAVSAAHRAEAYAASQYLIDQIKHDVPIWKRERYDDGTSRWVSCAPETMELANPSAGDHAHV